VVATASSSRASQDLIEVREFLFRVLDRKGKLVVLRMLWEVSDPAVEGHKLSWSVGINREWVRTPMNQAVANAIAARAGDQSFKERYEEALAAAKVADEAEARDLAAAKTAKARGSALTDGQREAVRNDRRRKLVRWGGVGLCALLVVALVALTAVDGDDEKDGDRSRDGSCRTSSADFVREDDDMDPSGAGAEAVRAGGFLVTSNGDGGSCVYVDE
jgi:hypothetical protein